MRHIKICRVWCIEDPDREKMGLDSGDTWLPFAIDFASIIAIKECGANDFLGEGKATLYFANEIVTIDMQFDAAVEIWRASV